MPFKTTGNPEIDALYTVHNGRVDFVDVPALAFVMLDGAGAPEDESFSDAIQALYSLSYAAHFALKKESGAAPRVRMLEGLWWVDGPDEELTMRGIASGTQAMEASDRSSWRWRLMIMQLAPIDEDTVALALASTRAKSEAECLDRVQFVRWAEGRCAQILHSGPYATEQTSVVALHDAIAESGCRPRDRHHEIYLSDPRRTAPEKMRTILRQPVGPLH